MSHVFERLKEKFCKFKVRRVMYTHLIIIMSMISALSLGACSKKEATPCDHIPGARLEGKMPPLGKSWACVIDHDGSDVRHGPSAKYDGKGQIKEEYQYEVGVKHGPYKLYHENGQIKESGIYKYGLQNGRFSQFYTDGKIKAEGTYQDGKLSGKYKYISDNGNQISEGWYLMGHKNGEWINSYIAKNGRPLQVKQMYYYGDIVIDRKK